MHKCVPAFLMLVLAHLSGAASAACQSAILLNSLGSPPVVYGNRVEILFSGESGDHYIIDNQTIGVWPLLQWPNNFFQDKIVWSLPYGTHTARTTWLPCVQQFTVAPPPTAGPGLNTVYRFYMNWYPGQSDHWSTLNFNEGASTGKYEGVYFATHPTKLDNNMVKLYRCLGYYGGGDHFADTNANCGGHTNEGSYGWISKIPRSGYVPLYRFVRLNPWDFIETTSWSEVQNWQQGGYVILGYVPQ